MLLGERSQHWTCSLVRAASNGHAPWCGLPTMGMLPVSLDQCAQSLYVHRCGHGLDMLLEAGTRDWICASPAAGTGHAPRRAQPTLDMLLGERSQHWTCSLLALTTAHNPYMSTARGGNWTCSPVSGANPGHAPRGTAGSECHPAVGPPKEPTAGVNNYYSLSLSHV
jgi:hypothetical protein